MHTVRKAREPGLAMEKVGLVALRITVPHRAQDTRHILRSEVAAGAVAREHRQPVHVARQLEPSL